MKYDIHTRYTEYYFYMKSTENINENTQNLDLLSTEDFVSLYLEEDKQVHQALCQAKTEISKSLNLISKKFLDNNYYEASLENNYSGPRLFYIGAGTSGRLGILDASECPPTFSAHPEMIQGIIAGGDPAIKNAIEGAEDDEEIGYKTILGQLSDKDTLVAISASGGAAYVIGALKAAKEKGALRIAVANNFNAEIFDHCEQKIFLDTGAEILSGSTRLKAGTSQKILLNILSTGLMTKLGKVYSNLMVDLKATNKKLVKRAVSLVQKITNAKQEDCIKALEASEYKVKNAALMIERKIDFPESENILKAHKGNLREALDQ